MAEQTPMDVVKAIEQSLVRWRNCEYTSDMLSVQLHHHVRDVDAAVDREEGE